MYNTIAGKSDNLTEYGTIKESVYISELYPYRRLVSYIAAVYTHTGLQPDYNVIKTLTYEDGLDFYGRRNKQLINTLNIDYSYGNYSDAEKNIVLKFNENVSEPYIWGYTLGWESLIEYAFPFFVILTFTVLINVSPAFSNEFRRGTVQVILSSKHGRSKIFTAKIISAFLISTLMFKQYKLYGFSDILIRQPYFVMLLMPVLSVIFTAAAKRIYSRLSYD